MEDSFRIATCIFEDWCNNPVVRRFRRDRPVGHGISQRFDARPDTLRLRGHAQNRREQSVRCVNGNGNVDMIMQLQSLPIEPSVQCRFPGTGDDKRIHQAKGWGFTLRPVVNVSAIGYRGGDNL